MQVTIPNPDRPAEVEQIESVMSLLEDCQNNGGGYDVIMLGKWLENHKDEIWNACARLREAHDVMYPPTVLEINTEAKEVTAA